MSETPAVCACVRSIIERGFFAPKRSFMMLRPHAARRAQLGDLFEEVVVQVPEERQARREFIDVEAALDRILDVADAVGEW